MKTSYDPRCEELARFFLAEEYGVDEVAGEEASELAGAIQLAIEDWFAGRTGKPRPSREEPEDESGQGEEK